MKEVLKNILIGLGVLIVSSSLIVLLLKFPIQSKNLGTTYSNLLTVSSILTGIGFAYIISKLFQLRNERLQRNVKIYSLSEKLTKFRKILYLLKHRHDDFWVDRSHITRYKDQFPFYSYNDIHAHDRNDENIGRIWSEDRDFNISRVDLFLAMEEIVDDEDIPDVTWPYDESVSFVYSLDTLQRYYDPCNQIWYYLDPRDIGNLVDDTNLATNYFTQRIGGLANGISEQYRNRAIDKNLISDLGAKFHGFYMPKLIDLTWLNSTDIATSFKGLITIQILILLFGVIMPLLLSSISVNAEIQSVGLTISLGVVISSLLIYAFALFKFTRNEINVFNDQ